MSEQVTITVYVSGTCPTGHNVGHNLQATVPKGSTGVATASANCGACEKPVSMTGSY